MDLIRQQGFGIQSGFVFCYHGNTHLTLIALSLSGSSGISRWCWSCVILYRWVNLLNMKQNRLFNTNSRSYCAQFVSTSYFKYVCLNNLTSKHLIWSHSMTLVNIRTVIWRRNNFHSETWNSEVEKKTYMFQIIHNPLQTHILMWNACFNNKHHKAKLKAITMVLFC